MENIDKVFISIHGNSNIGKSVELKRLIYGLSQHDNVKSCMVRIAKIKKGDFDFAGNLVGDDLKTDDDLKEFLTDAVSEFVDIKEPDNRKQFQKCLEGCKFNNGGEYEIDFVAIIEISSEDGKALTIAICTIGDSDDMVRWNLCSRCRKNATDKEKYRLNKRFEAADVIICALSHKTGRNGGTAKQLKIADQISKCNIRVRIDVKVSESTKIAGKKNSSEKSFSVELAVDIVLENLLGKLIEGLSVVVSWLRGIVDVVNGKNDNGIGRY